MGKIWGLMGPYIRTDRDKYGVHSGGLGQALIGAPTMGLMFLILLGI